MVVDGLVVTGAAPLECFASLQAMLSGADVFMLYDTFGFPLEITSEVAEAEGVGVDTAGFQAEMEAQRKRAQDARQEIDLTAKLALGELAEQVASAPPQRAHLLTAASAPGQPGSDGAWQSTAYR